jgi:hypothetical protein
MTPGTRAVDPQSGGDIVYRVGEVRAGCGLATPPAGWSADRIGVMLTGNSRYVHADYVHAELPGVGGGAVGHGVRAADHQTGVSSDRLRVGPCTVFNPRVRHRSTRAGPAAAPGLFPVPPTNAERNLPRHHHLCPLRVCQPGKLSELEAQGEGCLSLPWVGAPSPTANAGAHP